MKALTICLTALGMYAGFAPQAFSMLHQTDANGDQLIYEALHAVETVNIAYSTDGTPTLGIIKEQRSVGGLSCIKSSGVYPGALASYTCTIEDGTENDSARSQLIWDAIVSNNFSIRNNLIQMIGCFGNEFSAKSFNLGELFCSEKTSDGVVYSCKATDPLVNRKPVVQTF